MHHKVWNFLYQNRDQGLPGRDLRLVCIHIGPIYPTSSSYSLPSINDIRFQAFHGRLLSTAIPNPSKRKMGLHRGMQGVVAVIVFNTLAGLLVFLRCISRFWVIHQAGPEDYLIIAALVFSCGNTITFKMGELFAAVSETPSTTKIALSEVQNGLGRRTETLSDEEVQKFLKVSGPLYLVTLADWWHSRSTPAL